MSHSAALERFDQNESESGGNLVYIYLHKMNGADFEIDTQLIFTYRNLQKLEKSSKNH